MFSRDDFVVSSKRKLTSRKGPRPALRASQRFVDRDLSERVIIIIVIESTKRDV